MVAYMVDFSVHPIMPPRLAERTIVPPCLARYVGLLSLVFLHSFLSHPWSWLLVFGYQWYHARGITRLSVELFLLI